jgi:hypothetical protein
MRQALPFFTPQADGIIQFLGGRKWRFSMISGELNLSELQAGTEKQTGVISLKAGDTIEF